MKRRFKGPSIREIAASGQVLEMEQASRAAQRLALIVESHGDAILSVDLRRRVRTWNPAAQRMLGFREADIVGKPITLLAPPPLRGELLATVRRAARKGHAELETRRLRKDGSTVCVSVGVAPLRDPRGRIIGFSATLRDVSARRRIEEALQRSELKLRAITNSAKDAIILMDNDGKVSFWNPAAEKMFGRTRDEAVGRPLHETFGARAHLPAFRKRFAKWRRTGAGPVVGKTLELSGRRRDGTEFPIELSVSSLFLDGRWHAVGIARDISARRRAESVLKASEEKYRALVETTDTGYLILDGAGRVVDANREYLRLTGRRKLSDILGRSVVEWTAAHERQRNAQAVARCIRDRGIRDFVIDYVNEAGRVTPVEINATVVGDDASLRIISLCRDITARRRAEDAVRESEGKFRRLVEGLQHDHFFYRHGTDGVFSYVSPSVKMILGYEQKEFLTHYSEYLTDDPVNRGSVAHTDRSILGETQPPYEVDVFHRDGSPHRLRVLETPVFDAAGRVVAVEGMAQDITQPLRAAEALRESEEKYRALFRNGADGIIAADAATGVFVFANPAWCRMFGYAENEVLRLSVRDVHPKEALPRALSDFAAMGRDKKRVSNDMPCLRKDGSVFYADISAGKLTVGGRTCLMAIFRDCTERERSAEAVRERETRYRTLFESAADGIVLMPATGGKLIVNASFARMHGYTHPKEMAHLRLSDLDSPESARLAPERLRRLRAGERLCFEVEHRRKDGRLFPLQVTCNLIDIAGEPFFLGFHRDITERRRVEAAFHDSEARFRTLIDSAPLAIGVFRKERITLVNKAFLGLFGFSCAEQIVGKSLFCLIAKGSLAAMREQHRRRMHGGHAPEVFETVARRRNGATFPMSMRVGWLLLPEGPSAVCYFTDISSIKRGQRQLRDMHARVVTVQETERRRLSRDLHDGVGQILSGAKYSLHTLASELAAASLPSSRRVLKVADLLDRAVAEVRRVSWDLMPPELESMGLAAVVRTHCRDFMERWNIRISVECGSLPGGIGREMSLALYRILQESLTNIGAHARATRVSVRLSRKGGGIELGITDNGTGFVVERRLHRKGRHGAGLANIQERVESFGGTLALFSEPGRGTQLVVRFPLTRV